MKITSFHIQNYKCLSDVRQDHCTDFHALVGSNSSGKSSIFEAINLVKRLISNLTTDEIVCGGVGEYDTKQILVDLEIQLPDELRENYLFHFLSINQHSVDKILKTKALQMIRLQIVVNVAGDKAPDRTNHLMITLRRLEVSIDETTFYGLYETLPDSLQVKFKKMKFPTSKNLLKKISKLLNVG